MATKKASPAKPKGKSGKTKKGPGARHIYRKAGQPYPLEFRLKAIQEVVERGTEVSEVSRALGVSSGTLSSWVVRWQHGGREGLKPSPRNGGGKPESQPGEQVRRQVVVNAKREHPEHGARRIRDELERFAGIGVSEALVRRILVEEGLIGAAAVRKEPSEHPPRRFERAEPNELWMQSGTYSSRSA